MKPIHPPKREMFLITQTVVMKIVTRYGYEKLGEFTFLLSQYCIYWDNFATAEGFDFSQYSEAVLIYFDTVRDEIDEKHRQFIAQGEQMAKLAKERWEKENQEERRREQQRQWHVDNSEKINQKRRQQYVERKKSQENEMSSDVSNESTQSQGGKGVENNDAYRTMNYELMNNKNFKRNYDSGVCANVDKLGEHDPSSGLTGHNLAKTSVVNGNHKNKEHKNHKKRKNRRTLNEERRSSEVIVMSALPPRNDSGEIHNSPQPSASGGQLPTGERGLGKSVVSPPAERKTIYGDTWIKIGDDFKVDLFDPEFAVVDRGSKFLINGFQNFARKKWNGERKDKWWLRDQLTRNFANRQGNISYMTNVKK